MDDSVAKLPDELPGEFFLLQWDRDRETYLLLVDDEDVSSFNLGSDLPLLMAQFKRWGYEETGYRAIDVARSFGQAQAVLHDGRVIPIFDRPNERVQKVNFEEAPNARVPF